MRSNVAYRLLEKNPVIAYKFLMFDAGKVKNEIVQWIQDYFAENGRDCRAVVGISGGKDSSITAALCVQALGADKVYGVLMPRGEQWDIDVARQLVALLNIPHAVINIENTAGALWEALQKSGLLPNEPALINTPARIRMAVLYAVAAITGGRVANTCNLSEDWVGYSTKFGDSAGDFSPLSRLTVTEVKAVGRELGLPDTFIDKIPEDGLSGISDEGKLGFSYEVLDKYIREGICADTAVKEKIDRLHQLNLHKLALMPCYELP